MAEVHEVAVPDVGRRRCRSPKSIVKPGDPVWADAALITVESGKAALDVQAPVDGTISGDPVAPGDSVAVGSVVARDGGQHGTAWPGCAIVSRHSTATPSAPPCPSLFAAFTAAARRHAPPLEEIIMRGAGTRRRARAAIPRRSRRHDLGMQTVLVEHIPPRAASASMSAAFRPRPCCT